MTDNVKETETYFRNLNDLFRTEGWKIFLNEINAAAIQANSVESTKDAEELHFRKGQLNILAGVLNFETQVANAQQEFESDESPE